MAGLLGLPQMGPIPPERPMAQAPGQASINGASLLQKLLDPSFALPIAGALMGNQGNRANFANAFGAAGQSMMKAKETNRTKAYFEKAAPEYAEMLAGGAPMGEVWKTYMEARKAQPTATDDIKEFQFAKQSGQFDGSFTDWQTKGVKDQDATFGREQNLRKEYGATPEYKRYDDVRAAYERIRSSAQRESGAGDLGTIFGFMKMLDPGSVVREGEFANAENSAGVPERVRGLYNRVMQGERLTPEQRAEFVATADSLYQNESQRISGLNERFSSIAGQHQLDPGRIVVQPAKYDPLGKAGGAGGADPLGIR